MNPTRNADRPFPFWLLPVVLLSFWLGVRGLDADAIWYDEWFSLFHAGGDSRYGDYDMARILEQVTDNYESNPPGYYLLLHLWGRLVGWEPVMLRALSLLCAALAAAAIYRLARSLISPFGGLAAAAYSLSAAVILHAHEMRAYALYPLLVILLLWAYWRVALSPHCPRWTHAVGLALAMSGLIYTHYMGATVLIALGSYHLVCVGKDRRWLIAAVCAAAAGLAFAPWAVQAFSAASAVTTTDARQTLADDALTLLGKLLHTFGNGAVVWVAGFGWFALLAALRRESGARFALWMALVTIALTLLLNALYPFIIGTRYQMGTFPLLALVIGVGAAAMARHKLRPGVWLALFAAGGVYISLNPPLAESINNLTAALRLPWSRLAPTLHSYPQASDRVIALLPDGSPYWFYAPVIEYALPITAQPDVAWIVPPPTDAPLTAYLVESLPEMLPDDYAALIGRALTGADSFWLATSPEYPPSPLARFVWERAARDFTACSLHDPALDRGSDFALSLRCFARLDSAAGDVIRFGDAAALRASWAVDADSGRLTALLRWSHALPPYTHSAALHLEAQDGVLLAQADAGLPPDGRSCQVFALSFAPGAARLRVVLYDWQTGARLEGVGVGGAASDRPLLAAFDGAWAVKKRHTASARRLAFVGVIPVGLEPTTD